MDGLHLLERQTVGLVKQRCAQIPGHPALDNKPVIMLEHQTDQNECADSRTNRCQPHKRIHIRAVNGVNK
ncbi:hypothetical protein D3C75_299570 [compost metagenome]